MDHAEEQAQELEALEAILMDDLQGLKLSKATHVSSRVVAVRLASTPAPRPVITPSPCHPVRRV